MSHTYYVSLIIYYPIIGKSWIQYFDSYKVKNQAEYNLPIFWVGNFYTLDLITNTWCHFDLKLWIIYNTQIVSTYFISNAVTSLYNVDIHLYVEPYSPVPKWSYGISFIWKSTWFDPIYFTNITLVKEYKQHGL